MHSAVNSLDFKHDWTEEKGDIKNLVVLVMLSRTWSIRAELSYCPLVIACIRWSKGFSLKDYISHMPTKLKLQYRARSRMAVNFNMASWEQYFCKPGKTNCHMSPGLLTWWLPPTRSPRPCAYMVKLGYCGQQIKPIRHSKLTERISRFSLQ